MLNTSDVKSLSKGGTTVSLEEISNSIDNKLSIDNLTGGNGIDIAKNAAGDKVEVGISLPIVFSSPNPDSDGTIIKGTYNGSNPAVSMIKLNYFNSYSVSLSPVQIAIRGESNGHTDALVLGSTGINFTRDDTQYAILRQDNVKTVNGQSIYGSGDIDTTPTLKTVNSTSLTGDGNIYLKEFGVTDSNELNFKAGASVSDLYVGYATMSETGAKQTGYTISNYKFMKGTGSTSAFADLYCAKLYTSSDERLKENIESYEPTTSVLDLSIKEFNYKDSKVKSVGVIAQEVQKLFPDAVSADKKSGYLSVDDRSLMYMLMAEVKKLRDRVNELEGR